MLTVRDIHKELNGIILISGGGWQVCERSHGNFQSRLRRIINKDIRDYMTIKYELIT